MPECRGHIGSSGARIIKNTIYLLTGNVGVRALMAVSAILVTRYLGASDYGILAVAVAFAGFVSYITDLGLTFTFIREGSKSGANLGVIAFTALALRLFLSLVATIIIIISVPLLYKDGKIQQLVLLVALPSVWGAALQGWSASYFQLTEEMQYTALIRGVGSFSVALLLLIGIVLHLDIWYFAFGYGAGIFISGVLGLVLVYSRGGIKPGWDLTLLDEIVYFSLGGILWMAFPRMGTLILERVTTLEQVGYFAATWRVPSILYLIPGAVAAAFYPVLCKRVNIKRNSLGLVSREMNIMLALSCVIMLPFLLYPDFFLGIIFGRLWVEPASVATLKTLVWLVVLQSLNYPLADALTTQGLQRYRAVSLAIAGTFGVIFYVCLGQAYGAFGGALAAIGSELVLFLCLCLFLRGSRSVLLSNLRSSSKLLFIILVALVAVQLGLPGWLGIWLPSCICFTVFVLDNRKEVVNVLIPYIISPLRTGRCR